MHTHTHSSTHTHLFLYSYLHSHTEISIFSFSSLLESSLYDRCAGMMGSVYCLFPQFPFISHSFCCSSHSEPSFPLCITSAITCTLKSVRLLYPMGEMAPSSEGCDAMTKEGRGAEPLNTTVASQQNILSDIHVHVTKKHPQTSSD